MFQQPDPAETRSLATKCYGCCKAKEDCEKLNRCSACQVITYCCKECQKNDWDEHKQFCKIVKKCPIFFKEDYEGYAYRQYLIFQATKNCPDQAQKDFIQMSVIRDLIMDNHQDFMSRKCYSMEGFMALKEALLIDLAHSKRDKSVSFLQTPKSAHALLNFAYSMMTAYPRMMPVTIRFAREMLRMLSQILYHEEASVVFIQLLEADYAGSRRNTAAQPNLLQLLVKFMTEFDEKADDVEGLAWLCFALAATHLENKGLYSTIIEDTLNLVQLAGREATIIPQLYNLAKFHARQTLMR